MNPTLIRSAGLVAAMILAASAFVPAAETRVSEAGGAWTIENDRLRVRVTPGDGTIAVRESTGGRDWASAPGGPRFVETRRIDAPAPGIAFAIDAAPRLRIALTLPADAADLHVAADLPDRSLAIGTVPCLAVNQTLGGWERETAKTAANRCRAPSMGERISGRSGPR